VTESSLTDGVNRCAHCGTELAPHSLACPACRALVYSATLKQLAAEAEAATSSGDLVRARDRWQDALRWLPPEAPQHAAVSNRVADLTKRIEAAHPAARRQTATDRSWWQRGAGAVVTVALLLVGKLKFLLLGLTKASTFFSMFAYLGVYWGIYGWKLALGLVISIYIHEMGHVMELRRLGIAASAPLFIPGVGALVMLKQRVEDPKVDARIGLAGPIWGLGAGVAAFAVYTVTKAHIWLAISELTAFLNLFNLIPVWQLDGSRGFHALSRPERWGVVAAILVALLLTEQSLLFVVGAVAVFRAMQRQAGPGDRRALVTFVVLVLALSWMARVVK
jgi:Zn-dependent protease